VLIWSCFSFQCDVCKKCKGFAASAIKSNMCESCGHLRSMHTNKRLEDPDLFEDHKSESEEESEEEF
jgi:hypothetical protein